MVSPGRVLINESWVSGAAPMSALEPTPAANPRVRALPPVAKGGSSGDLTNIGQISGIHDLTPSHGGRVLARSVIFHIPDKRSVQRYGI